jgi:phenylalanine-4-hydroxylase
LGGEEKKPQYVLFDPEKTAVTKYPITMYQPQYFYTESFAQAKEKLSTFANSLNRPFQ